MKPFTKNSHNFLLMLFFLSLSLFSGAQSKSVILKSYAFIVESVKGNFPGYANEERIGGKVDTSGNVPKRIDTSIVIYVVTKNKLISWDTAWQKGQAYLITAFPWGDSPFQAGTLKGGSQVIIAPAKGNFICQLQLSPTGSSKNLPNKISRHEIILKGKYKGKTITLKTGPLVELIPIPSV